MSEWIRVKDMVPPKADILCLGKCGKIHVGHYLNGSHCHVECCYDNGGHFTGEEFDFTHWMPLPEPPKE